LRDFIKVYFFSSGASRCRAGCRRGMKGHTLAPYRQHISASGPVGKRTVPFSATEAISDGSYDACGRNTVVNYSIAIIPALP
jgi:hypothetical protein